MPRARALITATRIALAAALLFWLIHSGRLDPVEVLGAAKRWPLLVGVALLFYLQIAITAWRWQRLLRLQSLGLSFSDAFSLTMIGSLFNIVIPGSVGGDVVKAFYVAQRTAGARTVALVTIVVDRIVGLLGLLILAGAGALWTLSPSTPPELRSLCWVAITMAVGGTVSVTLTVITGSKLSTWQPVRWPARISTMFSALGAYRASSSGLPVAVGASVVCHVVNCYTFALSAKAIGESTIPLAYFLLVTPLGLITTAVPIAPAGMGVGQAAFVGLLALVPGGSSSMGANAFTVYQCVYLLVYLTGFYHYLTTPFKKSR